MERKVFTDLNDINPDSLHESMTKIGFRRSQDIAYRPSCEDCTACKSVRIPVSVFNPSRSQRRIIKTNSDLTVRKIPNIALQEHYDLLHSYLGARHTEGGMTNMNFEEFKSMVECSPVDSCLMEYRLPSNNNNEGKLIGVSLTDSMSDSLSMVYSFFNVSDSFKKRSLGTYIILDHVARTNLMNLTHLYLGYWIEDSPKMSYKKKFKPLEILEAEGWFRCP